MSYKRERRKQKSKNNKRVKLNECLILRTLLEEMLTI